MISEYSRDCRYRRRRRSITIPILDQRISNLPAEGGGALAMVLEDFRLQLGRGVLVLVAANRARLDRARFLIAKWDRVISR